MWHCSKTTLTSCSTVRLRDMTKWHNFQTLSCLCLGTGFHQTLLVFQLILYVSFDLSHMFVNILTILSNLTIDNSENCKRLGLNMYMPKMINDQRLQTFGHLLTMHIFSSSCFSWQNELPNWWRILFCNPGRSPHEIEHGVQSVHFDQVQLEELSWDRILAAPSKIENIASGSLLWNSNSIKYIFFKRTSKQKALR